jgi:hypothetical protein
MANKSKNRANQPPTGEGKKQSPVAGESRKLQKRSEVLQADRGNAEQNIGMENEERTDYAPQIKDKAKRAKAGR